MCFGYSKEPSHRDGSFEYPQHMFCMRNKENSFPIRTLIWRPEKLYNPWTCSSPMVAFQQMENDISYFPMNSDIQ